MFDFRLVMCDPNGARQGVINDVLDPTITFVDSSTATISFAVQREFTEIPNEAFVVGVEYTADDGGSWWAPRNDLFIVTQDNRDNVKVADTVKLSGVSYVSWLMGRALLQWTGSAVNGERLWLGPGKSAVSAGYIIAGMLAEAKNRGWGPSVSYDFNGNTDSLGTAWTADDKVKQSFQLLTPLTQALGSLAEQGLCDWWTEGMKLRLVRGGTGSNLVQEVTLGGEAFSAAPRRTSADEMFTHLTVVPEKARSWLYLTNSGADGRFGRLEATMTQSGVEDHVTAVRLAQPALVSGRTPLNEWTYTWTATSGTPVPFAEFNVGDNVTVLGRVSLPVPLRVVGLVLTRGSDGLVTVDAVVGSKLLTQQARRARRTDAATVGGTTNGAVGGSGVALPAGKPRPYPRPAAPAGLTVVSNVGYFAEDGTARSRVKVTWPAVVLAEGGGEITAALYEVWSRVPPALGSRATATDQTEVTLDLPAGVEHVLKVRAQTDAEVWGGFSAEMPVTPALPAVDLTPPTAPVLTGEMATISAAWDGLLTTGAPSSGFRHVVSEVASSSGGTYTQVGQSLARRGSSTWPADVGVTRWVRFVAVDRLGRRSNPSASVQVTVRGVVDQAINDAIDEALEAANRAQSTADGKVTISPNSPVLADGSGKPTGALWWRRNTPGAITGLWEWSGSAWTVRPFDESFVPQINIGSGTYGELDGVRLKADSVSARSILVSDYTNLVAGSDFEDAAKVPWDISGAAFTLSATAPRSGAQRLNIAAGASVRVARSLSNYDVQEGEEFYVELWARRDASFDGARASSKLSVRNKEDGSLVAAVSYALEDLPAANSWTKLSGVFTVPAGVTSVYFDLRGDHTAGLVSLDDITVRRRAAGELIVDGAVTTRALAADAVTAAKLDVGAVRGRHMAVGVDETGQRVEIVGTGVTVFDSDNTPTVRLGTAADDVLTISKKNTSGELVTVASIDEAGAASFNSIEVAGDVTFPSGRLVGAAGDLTYNGQFVDTPLLERAPVGVIWAASLGEDSGSGRMFVDNSTASALALGIGSVNLNPGRIYTIGFDRTIFASWVSGSSMSSLVLELWIGQGTQSVTSPNGVVSRFPLLEAADASGVMRLTPASTSGILRGLSGQNNVLARVVNPSNRPARFYTIDAPPSILLRDEGPDISAFDGGVIYTRASTGNVSPPVANVMKTAVFDATWSVLWGPSGSIRPAGSSLYDDGRMLQGGNSGARAGQVGFPALGLSGKSITGVWLRLRNRHTSSNSGATVDIGTHGNASPPSGGSPNNVNTFTAGFAKGQERWVPVPQSLWSAIAAGTVRGFQIGGPNVNSGRSDYGIFDGHSTSNAAGSAIRPQLKVSYRG